MITCFQLFASFGNDTYIRVAEMQENDDLHNYLCGKCLAPDDRHPSDSIGIWTSYCSTYATNKKKCHLIVELHNRISRPEVVANDTKRQGQSDRLFWPVPWNVPGEFFYKWNVTLINCLRHCLDRRSASCDIKGTLSICQIKRPPEIIYQLKYVCLSPF